MLQHGNGDIIVYIHRTPYYVLEIKKKKKIYIYIYTHTHPHTYSEKREREKRLVVSRGEGVVEKGKEGGSGHKRTHEGSLQ